MEPLCEPWALRIIWHSHPQLPACTALAEHPQCPQDILAQLAVHRSYNVRQAVAFNFHTPPQTLEQLAGEFPAHVAQRGSQCPPRLLVQLAGHDDYWVRRAVAENHSCPPEVLANLVNDPDPWVRSTALKNLNLPEEYRVLAKVAQ